MNFELAEDARAVIVAPNRRWFEGWARVDCDPPLNPNDKRFYVITSQGHFGRGFNARPGDKLVILGAPDWIGFSETRHIFLMCGFTEYMTDRGNVYPL